MTGIVDYGAGNIRSVERALSFLKSPFVLSERPCDLECCDRLIFPGVGDALYAMKSLHKSGFDGFLRDWVAEGKRLMGICLGSQIIFDYSEEGNVQCLGILKGCVKHISAVWRAAGFGGRLKVPHMGWNNIAYINGGSSLLDGVMPQKDFYFVHSYIIQPDDTSIVKAQADYGVCVPAVVEKGSVTAFQFHPEKSGDSGIRILQNFVKEGSR